LETMRRDLPGPGKTICSDSRSSALRHEGKNREKSNKTPKTENKGGGGGGRGRGGGGGGGGGGGLVGRGVCAVLLNQYLMAEAISWAKKNTHTPKTLVEGD